MESLRNPSPKRHASSLYSTILAQFCDVLDRALLFLGDLGSFSVPGSTPPGYTNAGPYVEMRFKGMVEGVPVYEFTYTTPSSVSASSVSGNSDYVLSGSGLTGAFQLKEKASGCPNERSGSAVMKPSHS
jgi:hypothetical protein